MKKQLFVPSVAAMLLLAGCSSQDIQVPAVDDGTVSFVVSMLASINGRAYGNGALTKQLHYAVYDANNETAGAIFASDVPGSPMAENSTIDFTLTLNLVNGKTYDFIFWADAVGNDFYKFSSEKKNVEINYASAIGNDDTRDAFFQAVKGVKVSGAMTQPVELRRPFAQLNFGTDDIEAAAAAKTVIKSTAVTVKGVYTKLDLYSGIASDAATVTFTSEALPEGEAFPIEGDYDYLTMDYLLTGIELEGDGADVQSAKREVMDATLTFTFADGQTADVAVRNMPVQRNYRTNVFGSLLTSPMDLDIIVKPGFNDEPGHIVDYSVPEGKAMVGDKTFDSLADAFAAVTAENTAVKLGKGTYELPATMPAVSEISISGTGAETIVKDTEADIKCMDMDVTLQDLTLLKHEPAGGWIPTGFSNAATETYKNVTVQGATLSLRAKQSASFEDCTFSQIPETNKDKGRYAIRVGDNPGVHVGAGAPKLPVSFKNCKFYNANGTGILVFAICADVTIDGCTFEAGKYYDADGVLQTNDFKKDSKAAIELATTHNHGTVYELKVAISNCKASGFDLGSNSGIHLWNYKEGLNDALDLTVDGQKVISPVCLYFDQYMNCNNPRYEPGYYVYNAEGRARIEAMRTAGWYKDGVLSSELQHYKGYNVNSPTNKDADGNLITYDKSQQLPIRSGDGYDISGL